MTTQPIPDPDPSPDPRTMRHWRLCALVADWTYAVPGSLQKTCSWCCEPVWYDPLATINAELEAIVCIYCFNAIVERTIALDLSVPRWETCQGCERQYRFPHLCREHLLCGSCHAKASEGS